MTTITHDQAIRLLMTTPDPLSMLVRHEPPPTGLQVLTLPVTIHVCVCMVMECTDTCNYDDCQELTLVTKPGEGFGISLSGGVNGYHGNLLDETDEGIFISQVHCIYLFLHVASLTDTCTVYMVTNHLSSQGWASRCLLLYNYVCLSGLWLGRLLYLSFLSTFLKLVCYAHVFPCIIYTYNIKLVA